MFLSNRGSFRPETSGAYTLRRRGRRRPKSGSAIGACAVARLAGSGGPIGDYYGSANIGQLLRQPRRLLAGHRAGRPARPAGLPLVHGLSLPPLPRGRRQQRRRAPSGVPSHAVAHLLGGQPRLPGRLGGGRPLGHAPYRLELGEHGLGAVLALVGVVPGIRLDPVAQRAARRVPQLGGEVIHGHLAGHREPQIQRILLGPLVVHSNSLPDTWVSNLESAPPNQTLLLI